MRKVNLILLSSWMSLAGYGQNLVQLEYFIDTDAGVGNNTLVNVAPQEDGTFPFSVNLNSVTYGRHFLYVRMKDSDGKWGHTTRRTFELFDPAANKSMAAAEYFFDTDPGFGNGTAFMVSQDSAIVQNFIAATASLPHGLHKMYIRVRDSDNKWSHTTRRNVEVVNVDATLYVTGAEYFFGSDPGVGNATYISFSNPSPDSTFTLAIPQNQVTPGPDTLFVRVRDSINKKWSLTQWITKNFVVSNCIVAQWTGTISTNWHDPANWSCNAVPTAATEVIIAPLTPFSCEVFTGNVAECSKITAAPGTLVTVKPGAILNVFGN